MPWLFTQDTDASFFLEDPRLPYINTDGKQDEKDYIKIKGPSAELAAQGPPAGPSGFYDLSMTHTDMGKPMPSPEMKYERIRIPKSGREGDKDAEQMSESLPRFAARSSASARSQEGHTSSLFTPPALEKLPKFIEQDLEGYINGLKTATKPPKWDDRWALSGQGNAPDPPAQLMRFRERDQSSSRSFESKRRDDFDEEESEDSLSLDHTHRRRGHKRRKKSRRRRGTNTPERQNTYNDYTEGDKNTPSSTKYRYSNLLEEGQLSFGVKTRGTSSYQSEQSLNEHLHGAGRMAHHHRHKFKHHNRQRAHSVQPFASDGGQSNGESVEDGNFLETDAFGEPNKGAEPPAAAERASPVPHAQNQSDNAAVTTGKGESEGGRVGEDDGEDKPW